MYRETHKWFTMAKPIFNAYCMNNFQVNFGEYSHAMLAYLTCHFLKVA